VRDKNGTTVRIADARYMGDDARGWAAIEVHIPVSPRLATLDPRPQTLRGAGVRVPISRWGKLSF